MKTSSQGNYQGQSHSLAIPTLNRSHKFKISKIDRKKIVTALWRGIFVQQEERDLEYSENQKYNRRRPGLRTGQERSGRRVNRSNSQVEQLGNWLHSDA